MNNTESKLKTIMEMLGIPGTVDIEYGDCVGSKFYSFLAKDGFRRNPYENAEDAIWLAFQLGIFMELAKHGLTLERGLIRKHYQTSEAQFARNVVDFCCHCHENHSKLKGE